MNKLHKNPRLLNIGSFLILLIVIFFFWNSLALYPLQVLVVFFHESSHALAALLTGGQILEFVVVAEMGGYVISAGGNQFITLTAGYLGSLFWGILIFTIAVSSNYDRLCMKVIGSLLLIITLFLGSNLFLLAFGLLMGIAMIISATFFSIEINDLFLRLIGLTNMLFVPLDIYSDTIERSHLQSDAYFLAEAFGGTTIFWGGIWLIISIISITWCLVRLFKSKSLK